MVLSGWGALIAVGVTVGMLAEGALKKGIKSGRWTEADLEPVLRWLEKRWLTVVSWIPLTVWLVCLVLTGRWSELSLSMCIWYPVMTLTRVRFMLRKAEAGARVFDAQNLKPLRSEQWGR